jgi:hypothetical protein
VNEKVSMSPQIWKCLRTTVRWVACISEILTISIFTKLETMKISEILQYILHSYTHDTETRSVFAINCHESPNCSRIGLLLARESERIWTVIFVVKYWNSYYQHRHAYIWSTANITTHPASFDCYCGHSKLIFNPAFAFTSGNSFRTLTYFLVFEVVS